MESLVPVCLAATIVLIVAWAVAIAREVRTGQVRRDAARLQLATTAALALTCLTAAGAGASAGARWAFFLVLAFPCLAVVLWAAVRIAPTGRQEAGARADVGSGFRSPLSHEEES